jgi:hypothetical protein
MEILRRLENSLQSTGTTDEAVWCYCTMRTNALFLSLTAACALFIPGVHGGEAVFSADGNTVFCLKPRSSTVVKVSVPHKPAEVPEEIPLGKALGEKAKITSISRGKDEHYILTVKGDLYDWKPGSDPVKAGATPDGHGITDLAMHPVTGHLLAPCLSGDEGDRHPALTTREPEEKNLAPTESMPVNMAAPVFDGAGRLFFGVDACLCAGGVQKHDDGSTSFVSWPVAPLDAPGLDNGTSSDSLSITGIAPAGQWLYISMSSDVDGALVRVPLPEVKAKEGMITSVPASTRKARWKRFSATLNTVQLLESEDQPYFNSYRALCASPDGKKVFFAGIPILHPEREEYWSIDVKSGKKLPQGDMPLEE